MITLSDAQINQLLTEHPRAILDFYEQIHPKLMRYFSSRVRSHADGDELTQDTIVAILDSLPQFKHQSTFSTWAFSIARHELVDYYRRQKIKALVFSKLPFLERIVDRALGPQLRMEEIEAKQKIAQTFGCLSEGYALILRLRYIEGFSVTAIAYRLDISYKAAESRLSRAREAFAKIYVSDRSLVYSLAQILPAA